MRLLSYATEATEYLFIYSLLRFVSLQPLEREGGGSKSRLVGKTAAETIEMAYWFVKFVGDYEKVRKEEIDRSGTVEEEGHWFKKNTKRVVLLARYLVKFVGSFEKLFHSK